MLYGQENTASEGIDDSRDADEIALAKCFFAAGKPVFGICRGHQVLNVAFGGDLIQDVPDPQHHMAAKETGDAIHTVRAQHDLMREFYGEEFPVNSAHHQAAGKLGAGLIPLCVSDDGINEGFIHENGKVIGVQFHPERHRLCAPPPRCSERRKAVSLFSESDLKPLSSYFPLPHKIVKKLLAFFPGIVYNKFVIRV